MGAACGVDCQRCPAASRCGRTPNFCLLGRCADCASDPLLRMEVRRAVMAYLGGLELSWPRPVRHHQPVELPLHLPVLVQVLRRPARSCPGWRCTAAACWFPRVGHAQAPPADPAAGLSAGARHPELAELQLDMFLTPNFSVWRDASRFEMLVQQRRAWIFYHEACEAGLPVLPDISGAFGSRTAGSGRSG